MTSFEKGIATLILLSVSVLGVRYLNPSFDAAMEQAPMGFRTCFHYNCK